MQRTRFFRQDTVDALKDSIKQNLPWYRGQDDNAPAAISDGYREMSTSTSADFSCFDELNSNFADSDDRKNVLTIYNAFHFLSPQQATEERIWTYATHVLAMQYTAKRWNKIPSDDSKAIKYICLHYFVSGTRGLIRDNAVARLWWMGYIASRCHHYDLEPTLKFLLRNSDVRANLLERSSVSMSPEIFSGVIRILRNSLEPSGDPSIYQREKFREFMKILNRRGGRFMLNVLQEQKLNIMLDEISNKVTTEVTQ